MKPRSHVTHVKWRGHSTYGVATISRLLQIIGLFRQRALYKRLYSAKETYNFKEPTNRSHPMSSEEYLAKGGMRGFVTYLNESCPTCEEVVKIVGLFCKAAL